MSAAEFAPEEVASTSDLVDAALCVWERWLELLDNAKPDTHCVFAFYRNCHGMAASRDRAAWLAPYVHAAYVRACALGYDSCFDWEFVPNFMARITTLDAVPDWRAIGDAIGAEESAT